MRIRLLVPMLIAASFTLIASSIHPAQANSTVTIVAVGDVARAKGGQTKTAALTKNLKPQQVLLLGDLAYQSGSDAEFKKYFLPKWKSLLPKTWAVPGNHEYKTANAAGYRNLVSQNSMPATGDDLWWVKQTGEWSVIGLDSEAISGTSGKRQIGFLKRALIRNEGRPTIVTWHRPTFSRGNHGNQLDTLVFWNLVSADKDVKLVLWGHDHNYEQVERTVATGTANEHRVNTFVIGTGGADLRKCKTPNIAGELICGSKNNYGVLQLKLEDDAYSWSYRNANGNKLGRQLDSGRISF